MEVGLLGGERQSVGTVWPPDDGWYSAARLPSFRQLPISIGLAPAWEGVNLGRLTEGNNTHASATGSRRV
jgi:hypothetical protein